MQINIGTHVLHINNHGGTIFVALSDGIEAIGRAEIGKNEFMEGLESLSRTYYGEPNGQQRS